ncbi:MAG: two-component system sensor histidine kinase CreC [Verrucomicrobia bacterium]|nr:MAG: two-component system sensor histidine kinase CreC [Verrucomicrobiota bacterium]TAE87219.1 MAG: two-component system sensor histidine kinase CreC [Verrucomicrobiota bacterium]TAF25055.1 MAG: two-component system sensor histidine kinase CreC [Verrucomicrobiota bacterium]
MRLTRVTLFFIALIIGAGIYLLVRQQLSVVEPQTYQATEESMVDTAQLLAAIVAADLEAGRFDKQDFAHSFAAASKRRFEANIHGHIKRDLGIGAYLTDAQGIVLFDSAGQLEGADLSSKRDVFHTLQGKYGARSSRDASDNPQSSVLYVGALVGTPEKPLGVLTVYKPQSDVLPIVRARRRAIYWGTGLVGAGILFLVAAVFIWQYRPVGRLTEYAREIESGKRPALPKLGAGKEVNTLARALESMREALEGRRYAERYVQTLTHEMKSPLAAIRGAAELLDEEMPAADRRRFLGNIRAESGRAERLLNRLLELSALEGRSSLGTSDRVDLVPIVARAIDQARPPAELAEVTLVSSLPETSVAILGDAFILRSAVTNLLENAIDFSPAGSRVEIVLLADGSVSISDRGPGIPDYARDKVFDRFYSLKHHAHGRKGTGLGLTLVKEAAELHGGRVSLEARDLGGTTARLVLPLIS